MNGIIIIILVEKSMNGIMKTYMYVIFASLQIFFLQGRFIFGPDVRSLGLTIFLIVAPVTIFCIFVARKLMDHFSHHLGILIMVVAVVFTVYVSSLSKSHTAYLCKGKFILPDNFHTITC